MSCQRSGFETGWIRRIVGWGIVGFCVAGTQAQSWNRKPIAVSVVPSGTTALMDVHVAWTIAGAGPSSVNLNVGTDLLLIVNGHTEVLHIPATVNAGAGSCSLGSCGGTCGNSTIDGLANDLFCNTMECDCRPLTLTGTFHAQAIAAGDSLTILTVPMSGAIADADPSDDLLAVEFKGLPLFWDRAIDSVQFMPGRAGTRNVNVTQQYRFIYSGNLPFDTGFAVLINGVPYAGGVSSADDFAIAECPFGCGGGCALDADGFPRGDCQFEESNIPWVNAYCHCSAYDTACFKGLPVEPGDVLTFTLLAQGRSVPELPISAFIANNQRTVVVPCLSDFDGDGDTDLSDLGIELAAFGKTAGGDTDGDGDSDLSDLGLVLSEFGRGCF